MDQKDITSSNLINSKEQLLDEFGVFFSEEMIAKEPYYLEKPSEIPAKTDENLTRLDPQTRTIIEDLIKRRETLINYTQIHGRHAAASVKDAEEIAKIDSKLAKWGIVLRPKEAA